MALVDTGAITLRIPEHVAVQLSLSELERREVTTATGNRVSVPYVGLVQVDFGNRSCFTGALVMGESVLLGAIPVEDMDLVIDPRKQEVTVNPESPRHPVRRGRDPGPPGVCAVERCRLLAGLVGR